MLLMMPQKRSIEELKALHIRQNVSKKMTTSILGIRACWSHC